ncbi:DUF192 domain-containing protein [Candidatus Woesearchaeota archaeon]|nr:DUF192 domain-containing protein [Candidatus Woesearchaeota archaeon]
MIRNQTKNKIIASDAKLCSDIFSKSLGLMFSKQSKIDKRFLVRENSKNSLHTKFKNFVVPRNSKEFLGKKNKALIFKFGREKIIALHMVFVFYPIDVLFLDKSKIVVDIKQNFKPFTFYKSGRRAMYAIELPNGVIKKTRTEIGDRIKF